MPKDFTPNQVQWLKTAISKTGEVEAAETRRAKQAKALGDILGDVETLRDDLVAAQKFQVELTSEQQILFWKSTKKKTMNWSEADADPDKKKKAKGREVRDIEVDTVHDLKDGFDVDPEAARKVTEMHGKLIALQTRMEQMTDDKGDPLFSPRDIERELWSPLVKANVIPSNAVADKYSQEAQVFNGAAEIYDQQLKEYSMTASKYDKVKRGLKIAKDTVNMMGSIAGESMKFARFDGVTMSGPDKDELKRLKEAQEAGTSLTPEELSKLESLKALDAERLDAAKMQSYLDLTVGLTNGAFDVADTMLDKWDRKTGWKIAEKIVVEIGNAAVNSIAADQATRASSGTSSDSYKDATNAAKNLVKYAVNGSGIIFRLNEALEAAPSNRAGIVSAMVKSLGAAVGSAFSAFDTQETSGQWSKVGTYVFQGIVSAASVAEIVKRIAAARDEGKPIDAKGIAAFCGFHVVGAIMTGTFETTTDAIAGSDESEGDKSRREALETKKLAEFQKNLDSIDLNALLKTLPAVKEDPEAQAKIQEEHRKTEEAYRKQELSDLQERLKDPVAQEKFAEEIRNDTEERQAALMELIKDATPTLEDEADVAATRKALAAVDKLIAECEATKTKWAVIDQLTSGGTAILVKCLPGAGLAVAIRQFAADVAYLVKKTQELNLWLKNTALTVGNDSVYGPAISGRLASAKIQFSQKTVNVVFSSVGVAAESMKLADITGAAAAVSGTNTMARALSDFGYEMHKEHEISKGWRLYKHARLPENRGDRKMARKAMQWNSTLSKCVLAYGIVIDKDPVAKEVGRNCGLTPEVLTSETDVCQKVVQYFVSLYSDDPQVMHRVPIPKDWHPGEPELTASCWFRFVSSANVKAVPPLADSSTKAPKVATGLVELKKLWGGKSYSATRDKIAPEGGEERGEKEYGDFLENSLGVVQDLIDALDAYVPRNGPLPGDSETKWTEGALHSDMVAICESLAAQATLIRTEISFDLGEYKGLVEAAKLESDAGDPSDALLAA